MIRKETFTDYDETPIYYVYNLVNPITGIPFYVGKGKNRRCYQHLSDKPVYSKNKRLTGHIRNLRESGIEPEVKKVKENIKEKDAYLLEEQILQYGRIGFDADGVLLNFFISNRPIKKFKEDNGFYGKKHTDETKRLISEANTGRKHTEEAKKKLSIAHTGRPKSEEHRRKISEKSKGKITKESTKQKLREHNLREDVLKKNIESKQKEWIVITPEGIEEEIINLSDYCIEHGLNRSTMYSVASGDRKHHKGYKCRKKNT
jgi:hypothetical protein